MQKNRLTILKEHSILSAPPLMQEAFWRSYNLPARKKRSPTRLGDVASGYVDTINDEPAELRRLDEAWRQALPGNLSSSAAVVGFKGGCLEVAVQGAAVQYALSRQWGDGLIELLNNILGQKLVRQIVYRQGGFKKTTSRSTTMSNRDGQTA